MNVLLILSYICIRPDWQILIGLILFSAAHPYRTLSHSSFILVHSERLQHHGHVGSATILAVVRRRVQIKRRHCVEQCCCFLLLIDATTVLVFGSKILFVTWSLGVALL